MVNQTAVSPDQPGGTRHFDLGVELVRRGFRVAIFASDVNYTLRRSTKLHPGELYRVEPVDGVDFIWVRAGAYQQNDWRRAWNMVSFARNALRVARRLGRERRPTWVIGSSPPPLAALAGYRMARAHGAHFVLELRDLWPQALIDMGSYSAWHPGVRAMRLLERYLYSRAERFVVLARGSQRYLADRGVPAERITFLPNGVHLTHFRTTLSREEARQRFDLHGPTIVYAGAHGPANSLETILGAAALLRDTPVEFLLVGDGPSKVDLVARGRRDGLSNVRFLAPVPKTEIPNLLNAADATVITLMDAKAFGYGVSPNKLLDYMAAGRPVLCSVAGEVAALVTEGNAGFTSAPGDPEALAAAVRRLLALSPTERERIGGNGRRLIERSYRRETLADRLAESLRSLGA
jgi:glycosyltransferase involved in cell wall biosynthesis